MGKFSEDEIDLHNFHVSYLKLCYNVISESIAFYFTILFSAKEISIMNKEQQQKSTKQTVTPPKHTHALWIRVLAILAVISVILGTVAVGIISVNAAENSVYDSAQYLPKRDVYFSDRTFSASHQYVIPVGSELMVEEGATLTIYGTLVVEGTLKNYGTIEVLQMTQPKDTNNTVASGYLSNKGTVINKGTGVITVSNGHFSNQKTGTLINEGTMNLSSNKEETVLQNISYKTSYAEQNGVIKNTGTIVVGDCKKAGIQNMNGGIFVNSGTILIKKSDDISGVIKGNMASLSA